MRPLLSPGWLSRSGLVLLNILAGVLLALSFTTPVLKFLFFLYFVPLFLNFHRLSGKALLWHCLAFFMSFWTSLVYWTYIYAYRPLPLFLILVVLGVYGLLWTLGTGLIMRYFFRWRVLLIPLTWVSLEYLTSLGYFGFPWGLAACSVSSLLPFIQIADLGGVWMVSFFVVLVNVLVAEMIVRRKDRKLLFRHAAVLAAVLVLGAGYGTLRLSKPLKPMNVRIGLVQPCVNPNLNWQTIRTQALAGLDAYTSLASADKPDLVVWPENAIQDYVLFNIKYSRYMKDPRYAENLAFDLKALSLSAKYGVAIALGILDVRRAVDGFKYYNSAVMVTPKSNIVGPYNKIHLVPFGEWFPLTRVFPFVRKMLDAVNAGDYTPGEAFTVFPLKDSRFSVLICYEGVFPGLARKFVLNGAKFFVNITDDMWSFNKQAHWQAAVLDIFRAVENRIPYVRCGNSGVTGVIDPYGRFPNPLPVLKPGYLVRDLASYPSSGPTLYTRWGDWFPLVCLVVSLFFLAAGIFLRLGSRRKRV